MLERSEKVNCVIVDDDIEGENESGVEVDVIVKEKKSNESGHHFMLMGSARARHVSRQAIESDRSRNQSVSGVGSFYSACTLMIRVTMTAKMHHARRIVVTRITRRSLASPTHEIFNAGRVDQRNQVRGEVRVRDLLRTLCKFHCFWLFGRAFEVGRS